MSGVPLEWMVREVLSQEGIVKLCPGCHRKNHHVNIFGKDILGGETSAETLGQESGNRKKTGWLEYGEKVVKR